jgi:predicted amidohydrolase
MEVSIALAQYPITAFTTFEAWKKHCKSWVEDAVNKGAQLLVFPEYASMELTSLLEGNAKTELSLQLLALQQLLPSFKDHFSSLAEKHEVIIVAPSFPVQLENDFVNRTYVFSPKNEGFQDKWFMTRFEKEDWGISSLTKQISLFKTSWGIFGIQTCYDIEFPIGSHLLAANGALLIVSPSCTETIRGATRVHIGARARAMEQQIYVGVSQTIGEALWSPAVDINYGFAGIYASPDKTQPEEGILQQGVAQKAEWMVQTIKMSLNDQLREDGQVFNFKDSQSQFMTLSEEIKVQVFDI